MKKRCKCKPSSRGPFNSLLSTTSTAYCALLTPPSHPAIKSKVPTAHNKARLVIAQNTHDQPAQGFSFSCEKQPQTAHGSGTGWGAARMKGSKIKLHRQTAMTPGQVNVKGRRRREQGALLVARCASSTCLDEAQQIVELDQAHESSPQPCVSRFSHMVDVHMP